MIERGLSKEEVAQLGLWLLSDPDNGQRLLDMAAVWDELAILAEPQNEGFIDTNRSDPFRQWNWLGDSSDATVTYSS